MKIGLRGKFLAPTLGLIIVGMAAATIYSVVNSSEALEESAREKLLGVAKATAQQIGSWLEDRRTDVTYWAGDPLNADALTQGGEAGTVLNRKLERASQEYKAFVRIHVTDTTGLTKCSSDPESIGKLNLSERDYFKQSMTGKTVVSDVVLSKASGKPVVVIASPVFGPGKAIIGALAGVVDLGEFTALVMDRIKIGQTGYGFLANGKGLIIAHPDKAQIMKLDIGSLDFGRRMLSEKEGVIAYEFGGVEKMGAFTLLPRSGWLAVATIDYDEMLASAHRLAWISLFIALGVVIAVGGTIFLVAQGLTKPINRIVKGMNQGAAQVASASGEVSSSSQVLADLATKQAASLEETSSSMEEMASMTRQNADNASQANMLMQETAGIVVEANRSMKSLRQAMERITAASNETSQIIRTIDEIAFQTNLLALNAAVEAARAGEAGAGFAVVADEVRNLALRAAEAAKNTQALIEENLKEIHQGSQLASDSDQRFSQVQESSGKVAELLGEIASASHEQAQGIDQINAATTQMDSVTQQMAATAEETAASSEELSAMSETMHSMVDELDNLVGKAESPRKERRALKQLEG